MTIAPSWWIGQPRQHFTAVCAQMLNTFVPVDQTAGDAETETYQRRCDMFATLLGVQQGKSNSAIKRAAVSSN